MAWLFRIAQWGAKLRPEDPLMGPNLDDLSDLADLLRRILGV